MRKEPKNPPPGAVRPPAPPAPPAKQADTRLAAEIRSMRETIAEYIVARVGYTEATRPPNSHAMPPCVSPSDPRIARYREASDELASLVVCGSCLTPIQADAMTGTTCACAPMIPMRGRDGIAAAASALRDAQGIILALSAERDALRVALKEAVEGTGRLGGVKGFGRFVSVRDDA